MNKDEYEYEYEYELPTFPRTTTVVVKEVQEKVDRAEDRRIPFGKYKGRFLSDIPTSYLKWYLTLEHEDKFNEFKWAVTAELQWRRWVK